MGLMKNFWGEVGIANIICVDPNMNISFELFLLNLQNHSIVIGKQCALLKIPKIAIDFKFTLSKICGKHSHFCQNFTKQSGIFGRNSGENIGNCGASVSNVFVFSDFNAKTDVIVCASNASASPIRLKFLSHCS